ncbi:transposase, partial [Streptococcus suis]
ITNAMELPYSNAKLEATNKLIKDIKRQAFGFRNFTNFNTQLKSKIAEVQSLSTIDLS